MNADSNAVRHPVIKCATAWGCAGGANVAEAAASAPVDAWAWLHSVPWGSLASLAAFVYSVALIGEWMWKRALRPLGERLGWIEPRIRIDLSESQWAEMRPRPRK